VNLRRIVRTVARLDTLNFVATNAVPRASLTRFMGWFSRIEHPLVRDLSMAVWRLFTDLDLSDARKTSFRSLHDCFIRELKAGARPLDPRSEVVVSPCDALVGACGCVTDGMAVQAKRSLYRVEELLGDARLARQFTGGTYVTLRLTSAMYHRFHAPHDCRVSRVTYFPGDVWNVNPPTLARVDRVYCRNERAVVVARLEHGGWPVVIVPVAAILVASLRLNFIAPQLHAGYRGPCDFHCDAGFDKGAEMGWFEHGSTILVFAPRGLRLADGIASGAKVRMGQALLRVPSDRMPEPER
jgi:phosphatidylserine decarboxylase